MIDKEIIRQRKKIYGDNISNVAEEWSDYLSKVMGKNILVTPTMFCEMMVLLKLIRKKHIQEHILDRRNEFELNVLAEAMASLEDTKKDAENYKWLGSNYKEYKEM
jgi:hypothetical protein